MVDKSKNPTTKTNLDFGYTPTIAYYELHYASTFMCNFFKKQ
jgi:hypothetical protein